MAHVITGVERAASALPGDDLVLRVSKAVGALQPIDNFPRTAENIAALLYPRVGDAPHLDEVRAALRRLLDAREVGLVDDPQTGGYTFLSEGVKPIRDKRNSYMPTTGELNLLRSRIVASLFDPLPSATLENAKVVRAGVQWGRIPIVGEDEEVHFRIEIADGASWEQRRTALLTETTGNTEWKAAIAWLMQPDAEIEDKLVEVVRSRKVVNETSEAQADRAVAQFVRSERAVAEANEDRVRMLYRQALLHGTFIFRGKPTPASVAGVTVDAAARKVLQDAAEKIYPNFHLVNIRPGTDLAAKFLGVERLERMPKEADPLGFVATTAGRARVNPQQPALAEALRVFREKLHDAGTTRLQGNAIQDLFAAAPYGWSKDATRYVFAGLLASGEVILHTSSGEVKTAGPAAIEALKNTQAFGKVGVSLRDTKVPIEMLERAASRLERLLGREVLPLEDHISRAVRDSMPKLLAAVASVPGELRLLELGGTTRAQEVYEAGDDLLGEDGVAAIAILGASECNFPDDMQWLSRVKTALESDTTTTDVGDARGLIKAADALHELFPSLTLVEGSESRVVQDILASDAFFDRLADLRTIARRVRDRAKQTYHEYYVGYQSALANAHAALESLPAWMRISDDDRQDIGNRLLSGSAEAPRNEQATTVLEAPEAGKEIAQLQLLLVRRSGAFPICYTSSKVKSPAVYRL